MYVETGPRQRYCFLGNVERGSGELTIAAADAADRRAVQQDASSIIARKIISGRFAALFTKGWARRFFWLQYPATQRALHHERKKYGDENRHVNERRDHSSDDRSGNRFHACSFPA